jgi:hypothetical protein
MGEGDSALLQGRGGAHGKTTLGKLGGALHENDDGIVLDLLIDTLQNVHWLTSVEDGGREKDGGQDRDGSPLFKDDASPAIPPLAVAVPIRSAMDRTL